MSPLNRRAFLSRSLVAAGAAGLGIAGGVAGEGRAAGLSAPGAASDASTVQVALDQELMSVFPFDGAHQAGILTPKAAQATFVALDSVAPNRAAVVEALQALTSRARELTQGHDVTVQEIDAPPPDSGILGLFDAPDQLTVTVGFGASLFDGRYGLSARRPRHLTQMPNFANDDLDPLRTGGDLLVQIAAGQRDTVVHALRELLRITAGSLVVRWIIDGFQGAQRGPTRASSPRNLFAFRDGTANPDPSDAALMNQLVWVQPGSGEPRWAIGGTYQVVRTIRMHVEFWDRVGLLEQEQMIGRDRASGAPLGGTSEFQDPDYPSDPAGRRIPLSAHIRVANPRTPATADQRILRRGYNYQRGVDDAGDLDQGLVFVAFNQDIARQFATIQQRLANEPMVDYITPVGGGYFFLPPGTRGLSDWIGSGLLAT